MTRLRNKPVGMSWEKFHEHRSCQSKRRFAHQGQARRFAHQRNLKVYPCKLCGGYHVTTPKT